MGSISFFEVLVDDFARAQKFYQKVFGWSFLKAEGFPVEYYMINNEQKQVPMGIARGGMKKRENPLTTTEISAIVCHILVDNIDQAIEKITQNGGKMSSEKQHIPAGWFAYLQDTEGNNIGIWEMAKGA